MEDISFIYYFNFVVLALIAIQNKKTSKGLQYLIFTYLSILVAIRYNVGADYEGYVNIFNEPSVMSVLAGLGTTEIGGFGTMALVKMFGLGVEIWFFLISMMTFVTLFKAVERFDLGSPWWGILIYYCLFFLGNHCNIVRHGAMVGWVWLAFSYVEEGNLKRYLLYCLIGASFQMLGLLMIPFYWVLKKKIGVVTAIIAISIAVPFNTLITKRLFEVLGVGLLSHKVEFYTETYYANQELANTVSIGVLVYTALLFALYFFKINENNQKFLIIRNALFFSMFFQFLFSGTGIFSERIGSLLNISLIIILPIFFDFISKKYLRSLKAFLLIYAFVIFVSNATSSSSTNNGYQFLPYRTIFSK